MRLELGGGPNKRDGYVSMDVQPWHGATDIVHDISRPWPIGDATVERIYSAHLMEHIAWHRLWHVLAECYRVLVPGGTCEHIWPEFGRIVGLYNYQCQCVDVKAFVAKPDCPVCHGAALVNPLYLKWSLVGMQQSEWDVHRNIIHEAEMRHYMEQAGFAIETAETVATNHVLCRVIGVKS